MRILMDILRSLSQLFRQQQPPSKIAKERLKLVISQDRFDIGQESMQELQKELMAVLAKHFDFTTDSVQISLNRRGNSYVLIADFPHSDRKQPD